MIDFVKTMGAAFGVEPKVEMKDWPSTEVYKTFADTSKLQAKVGWTPSTPLDQGLKRFAAWFEDVYMPELQGFSSRKNYQGKGTCRVFEIS